MPNNWVVRVLVIVIIVQILGTYMIIRLLGTWTLRVIKQRTVLNLNFIMMRRRVTPTANAT